MHGAFLNSSISLSEAAVSVWCWQRDVLAWPPPLWWSSRISVASSCTTSSSPPSLSSLCSASCSCLKANASRSRTPWRRARASDGRLSSCPNRKETVCLCYARGLRCPSTIQIIIPAWFLPLGRCWPKIICRTGSLGHLFRLCCRTATRRKEKMGHGKTLYCKPVSLLPQTDFTSFFQRYLRRKTCHLKSWHRSTLYPSVVTEDLVTSSLWFRSWAFSCSIL